ncbi:MAG: lysophospholipid acyltransferase family protein [Solitalea-like symbiont of Acarus siro]
MKKIRVIIAILITLFCVILRLPKIFFYKKTKNLLKLNYLRVRTFTNIYKGLLGIKLKITNKNKALDLTTPYIVCSNHSSYFDIGCVLISTYNIGLKDAFFITKKELSENFLFKHHILDLDVCIDRNNKFDILRGFKQASKKLNEGRSLMIFPEGTISKNYPPTIQD